MKISNVLFEAVEKLKVNGVQDARLQAKILMAHILKENEQFLIVHNQDELSEYIIEEYRKYIDKLIKGIPIQYITNKQEFMKLNFYVDENVLIPQPDTEILVEEVINNNSKVFNNIKASNNAQEKNSNDIKIEILDLCTGSGAIGISLAKYIENCKVTCTDISMKALQIAKLNAEKNLVHRNMEFILSDLFQELQGKTFNIIVSNPPYIKTEVIKKLDKTVQNEPFLALGGGEDGLYFYKQIAEKAYKFLKESGELYLEIGYDQKSEVIKLLKDINKYEEITCKKDLAGNDRVIIAKKKLI